MKVQFVDLKAQYLSIKSEIDNAIQNCIDNTAFIGGETVKQFEDNFAKYCNAKYCASCGNGTDALEIALMALNIKQGDEVIVPALSFISTSEAVTNAGGKPVFCDINPVYYTINLNNIEEKITSKTKAIIAVHIYGQMAEMDKLAGIAKKYNLYLIEDAAQAHGATYDDKGSGAYSDVATFSFYPGKNLGAYGDAGAIVTNNEHIYIKAKKVANHGRISKYEHEIEGRNSRLDAIQASVLNVKLKYIDEWTEKRRKNAELYNKLLKDCKYVNTPVEHNLTKHVYHLYVIKVPKEKRNGLVEYLKENQIAPGIHYPYILPQLKAYNYLNCQPEADPPLADKIDDFPIASAHVQKIISLPMYPELLNKEIEYVCDKVIEFLGNI